MVSIRIFLLLALVITGAFAANLEPRSANTEDANSSLKTADLALKNSTIDEDNTNTYNVPANIEKNLKNLTNGAENNDDDKDDDDVVDDESNDDVSTDDDEDDDDVVDDESNDDVSADNHQKDDKKTPINGTIEVRSSSTDNVTDLVSKPLKTLPVVDENNDSDDDDDNSDDKDDEAGDDGDDETVKKSQDETSSVETRSDFTFGFEGLKNPIQAIGDFIKALPKIPKLSWSGNIDDDDNKKPKKEDEEKPKPEEHEKPYKTSNSYYEKKNADGFGETTYPTDSWKDRESKDYYKYWYNSD